MSELNYVFVRHAGFILKVAVESVDQSGAMITEVDRSGIKATCYPDGRADIQKFNPATGVKVYDGLGAWCSIKLDLPTGVRIKIVSGQKIWSVSNKRWRIIQNSITVYADEDLDEFEYVFKYDLDIWTVGMENADVI